MRLQCCRVAFAIDIEADVARSIIRISGNYGYASVGIAECQYLIGIGSLSVKHIGACRYVVRQLLHQVILRIVCHLTGVAVDRDHAVLVPSPRTYTG